MDLRAIELLIAVAETGSFTKAAEKMYVTQPYVSKVIKQLEQTLNVTLFHRTTRQLTLTESGKVVVAQGQKALDPLKELPLLLNDLHNLQRGQILLGIPPVVGTILFPKMAQRFHEAYPNIELKLIEQGAKSILSYVEAEKIDIGFTVRPFEETNVNVYPYFVDTFMVFLSKDHELSSKDAIGIEDLRDETFIIFTEPFTLHDAVINACEQHGYRPKIGYKTTQWDLMIELVAMNMGVAILPKAIFEKQNNPNVMMLPIASPTEYKWDIAMVTKKNRYLSHATEAFLALFTKV